MNSGVANIVEKQIDRGDLTNPDRVQTAAETNSKTVKTKIAEKTRLLKENLVKMSDKRKAGLKKEEANAADKDTEGVNTELEKIVSNLARWNAEMVDEKETYSKLVQAEDKAASKLRTQKLEDRIKDGKSDEKRLKLKLKRLAALAKNKKRALKKAEEIKSKREAMEKKLKVYDVKIQGFNT